MEVKIYQIKEEKIRQFGFRSFDAVKKDNGLCKENYDLVYKRTYSEVDVNTPIKRILEGLFSICNENKPYDFRGRSLSVSDVVEVDGVAYYCNDFGWKQFEW